MKSFELTKVSSKKMVEILNTENSGDLCGDGWCNWNNDTYNIFKTRI